MRLKFYPAWPQIVVCLDVGGKRWPNNWLLISWSRTSNFKSAAGKISLILHVWKINAHRLLMYMKVASDHVIVRQCLGYIDEPEVSTSFALIPCNFSKVSIKFVKKLSAYYYYMYSLLLPSPTPNPYSSFIISMYAND